MHAKWFAAAVTAVVGLAAPTAHAEDRARATALIQQGRERFEASDFPAALRAFEEAYRAYASPKILFDIGRAAAEAHDELEAVNAFNAFIDQTTDAPEVHAQLGFAHEQLDARKARFGLVILQGVSPEGAISVDGQPAFNASWYVVPGKHELKVEAAGFRPFTLQVEVGAAERRVVVVQLERMPPPTRAPASAPPLAAATPPGPAGVLVAAPTALARARRARTAGWVLIGTGAATLAVSGVFGVLATSNDSRLTALVDGKSTDARPADADALRSTVKTDAWISTATLGAGVVAGAVGVYLLLTHRDPPAMPGSDPRGNPAVSLRF